jgi:hypothetical protein
MGSFHLVPKSIFPGPPGDIECGVVRPVNTMNGDFLGDAEALLAAPSLRARIV